MMTREEVINALKEIKDRAWGWHINEQVLGIDYDEFIEIMDAVLSFLDPVSRERVEKVWRGEWTVDEFGHKCSKCGEYLPDGEDVRKPQFCPECGRAMTDEAVEMVMEKINNMEEMTNEH